MRSWMLTGTLDTTLEALLTLILELDNHGRKLGTIKTKSQVLISSEKTLSHTLDFTKLLMRLILQVLFPITGQLKALFHRMIETQKNLM